MDAAWKIEAVEEMAGDASVRRYRRVRLAGGARAVEVIYPERLGSTLIRDLAARAWLERRGVRVPRLLAAQPEAGRVLLEDFGPLDAAATFERLDAGQRRARSLELLEPLAVLAGIAPAELPPWNPPLARGRLRWELAGFELWFLRYGMGLTPAAEAAAWLDRLAERVAAHPRRVCHRDYHLNNLFLLEDGTVGVIDFQDILVGPDTYDLVSLLGERDFPDLLGADARWELARRWAERTGAPAGWERRLEEVTVQRGLKVLGTFSRLVAAGRGTYRRWLDELVPRVREAAASLGAPRGLLDPLLQWRGERG